MSVRPILQSTGGYPLSDYYFDSFEVGLLSVARHFLADFAEPGQMSWNRAYTIAAERWGEAQGLVVAHHLHKVLRTTLDCRIRAFEFNDPLCPEARNDVTIDELSLLDLLHYIRRDKTAAARISLDRLTENLRDPHVITAALSFANRFPSGRERAHTGYSRPKLKVV